MLTADRIRDELTRAFAGNHGLTCHCCEPLPDGRSALDVELEREARYAVERYSQDFGLVEDAPTDAELETVAQEAAGDAAVAVREAITARVVLRLARAVPERPVPVVAPIDPATHRVSCRAETFDGAYHRQCSRPASFTRDGLEVCRQHARLDMIRPAS